MGTMYINEMEKFLSCPGLLKPSCIDKVTKNTYKFDSNSCAFFKDATIIIAKWKDDLTITMTQTKVDILLELWKSGKRVKAKRWSGGLDPAEQSSMTTKGTQKGGGGEDTLSLFAAAINFYELEDYINIETRDDIDLLPFNF